MLKEADKGLLVVISGPSGVGKTTLVKTLRDRLDGMLSISTTTRPKTAQDVEGEDYFFTDETKFKQMVDDHAFIEHAKVFGRHWYGTPRGPVEKALAEKRLVLLEIDVQGALQVELAWARDIRDQCADAGVALFMKQLGGRRDKRDQLEQFPEDLRIREFPAGDTLAAEAA